MPNRKGDEVKHAKEMLGDNSVPTTLPGRLAHFLKETAFVLLTTTRNLEDKAFEDGTEFFTVRQLALFGIAKRAFLVCALFYFFAVNFIQFYKTQKVNQNNNH